MKKIKMIAERTDPEPHMEIHYSDGTIEFKTLDGRKICEDSKSNPVYFDSENNVKMKETFGEE